jgi:hypothetical protein
MTTLSVLFLALATLASPPEEDMQKYLSDTEALVEAGKYPEALERHLWFHDHALEHQRSMEGVRLSFALSDWKKLGDVYPPARAALLATRDRKTQRILDTGESRDLFADTAAINRYLGQEGKTVELFQRLGETHPELAERCWDLAKDAVFAAKRYDLARRYLTDPAQEFERIRRFHEEMLATGRSLDPSFVGITQKVTDDTFVKESVELIQALLAVNQRKAAEEIQRKALAVVADRRLREAIPGSAAAQKGRRLPLPVILLGGGLLLIAGLLWNRRSRRHS